MDQKINEQKIEAEIDQEVADKKMENEQNYFVAKKVYNWFHYRTFGYIFLALAVLILITSLFIMKYLNYYFNFGPMDATVANTYKDANWLNPFNKFSWEVFPTFVNKIETVGSNQVVIIEGLNWTGTTMAVTRNALLINNIANGTLYIGTLLTLVIGVVLLLIHYIIAKPKIQSIMVAWTNAVSDVHTPIKTVKETPKKKAKPTAKKKAAPKKKPKPKPTAKKKAKPKPAPKHKAAPKKKAKPPVKKKAAINWKERALKAEGANEVLKEEVKAKKKHK